MGMGSGGGTASIDTIALPEYAWKASDTYITRALKFTREQGQIQFDYDGETFAEWNQDEIDGIAALVTRATDGSSIIQKSRTLALSVINAETINANPKIQALFNSLAELLRREFTESTLPAINENANNIGMFGSSGHCVLQAKSAERVKEMLDDIAYNIFYSSYSYERRRTISLYDNAIILGQEGIRNGELLRQAGLYKREYSQAQLTDAYKLWVAAADGDIKKIDIHANAFRALRGAYITNTEPYYRPSTMSQIAGLAMAGGSMAASFYGTRTQTQPQQAQQAGAGNAGGASVSGQQYNSANAQQPLPQ